MEVECVLRVLNDVRVPASLQVLREDKSRKIFVIRHLPQAFILTIDKLSISEVQIVLQYSSEFVGRSIAQQELVGLFVE